MLKLGTVAQTMIEAWSVEPSRSNHHDTQMVTSLSMTSAYDDYRALHCPETGLCYVMLPYYGTDDPFAMVTDLTSLSAESLGMDMIHFHHQTVDVVDPKTESGFQHCWD